MADPEKLAPHVQVAFLKKKYIGLAPSINLAEEKTPLSLEAYLDAVKSLHMKNPKNVWRNLGTIETKAGPAALTSLDTQNEWGPIRLFQTILLKEGTAYIITAAATQKEFPAFAKEFEHSIQSLTLTEDLLADISKEEISKLKAMQPKQLQAYFLKAYADRSPHWQLLALTEILSQP